MSRFAARFAEAFLGGIREEICALTWLFSTAVCHGGKMPVAKRVASTFFSNDSHFWNDSVGNFDYSLYCTAQN